MRENTCLHTSECIEKIAMRREQLEADQNPMEAAISDAQQDNEPTTAQKYNRGEDKQLTMSYALIERIVKKYKAHRCAMDFDTKFIKDIVTEMRICCKSEVIE